ncbi:MAG: 50S ribosomal protein L24 [Prevotellaceae bacterium]|jgi:large subunit ribosomal protein L24|nr:50S ribosomal protein L24 [Prevotellaceae bacterium]
MSKLHIKKGDNVIVIAGNSKSDKPRRVLSVYPDKRRALVEGVNIVSKSTKPSTKNPQGGVIKKESSIHISNLNVVDPKTGQATRIGRRLNAEGKLVRYSKKSGEEIK